MIINYNQTKIDLLESYNPPTSMYKRRHHFEKPTLSSDCELSSEQFLPKEESRANWEYQILAFTILIKLQTCCLHI